MQYDWEHYSPEVITEAEKEFETAKQLVALSDPAQGTARLADSAKGILNSSPEKIFEKMQIALDEARQQATPGRCGNWRTKLVSSWLSSKNRDMNKPMSLAA